MPTLSADLCPSRAGPLAFSEGPAMTSRLLALPPSHLPSSPSALYLLLRRAWPSGASPRREARPWALGKVRALCWLCGGGDAGPALQRMGKPNCAPEPYTASSGTCPRSEGKALGGSSGDLGSGLSSATHLLCAWSTSELSLRSSFLSHTNVGPLRWPRS